jgi:ABC-type Fe3+-hydroxamate transport system substrate-binding protein
LEKVISKLFSKPSKENKKQEEIYNGLRMPFVSCTDMIGRSVQINTPLKRVVSLVPSQTELLYALGLSDRIVGHTIFCVHPKEKNSNSIAVGGTKKVKFELIHDLNPDLVICNQEENTQDIVNQLSENFPVWVSAIQNMDDSYAMIQQIAALTSREKESVQLINQIKENFKSIKVYHKYDCIYLIWKKPYMTVGSDTFISNMMEEAGFINIIQANRYPQLREQDLQTLNPEVLLLSSEPYPFNESHIRELQALLPNTKILLVDGELFSWYGSRPIYAAEYFNELQRRLHKSKK